MLPSCFQQNLLILSNISKIENPRRRLSFHAAAPALWNSLLAELRELKWRRTSGCHGNKLNP